MTYDDLKGRVAVVTGGSRGIGAATALAFARNGMRVAVLGRDEAGLAGVQEQLWDAGCYGLGVVTDTTSPAQLAAARTAVVQELGPVDVLAAFAGGQGAPRASLEMPVDEWWRILDGDLTGTFLTIQAFLPDLVEQGSGVVITLSARAPVAGHTNVAYAVAKAGVVMLTRYLAAELAGSGVRVNCVAPAPLGESGFPLGRVGEPEDVANAAVYLASDASSWITGITLDVAGGQLA